jgi:hypothetical protein
VDGGRGARRGAGAGAIVGGASRGIQRSALYDRAYAHCMRGRWPRVSGDCGGTFFRRFPSPMPRVQRQP